MALLGESFVIYAFDAETRKRGVSRFLLQGCDTSGAGGEKGEGGREGGDSIFLDTCVSLRARAGQEVHRRIRAENPEPLCPRPRVASHARGVLIGGQGEEGGPKGLKHERIRDSCGFQFFEIF